LPGLVVDFQNRCVDIKATICLDEGMLELIACTKETKEHESIVTITARPMHVHTALLLLGANNGKPASEPGEDDSPPSETEPQAAKQPECQTNPF